MTAILTRLAHAGRRLPRSPPAGRRQAESGAFCASRARPPSARRLRFTATPASHGSRSRFLGPDLSMLAYLVGPRAGAFAYDLVHTYAGAAAVGCGLCCRLDCRLGACADLDRPHRLRPHASATASNTEAASATRISAASVASKGTANARSRHRDRPRPDQGKPDRRPRPWAETSARAAVRRRVVGLAADQRLRHRALRRRDPRRHRRVGRSQAPAALASLFPLVRPLRHRAGAGGGRAIEGARRGGDRHQARRADPLAHRSRRRNRPFSDERDFSSLPPSFGAPLGLPGGCAAICRSAGRRRSIRSRSFSTAAPMVRFRDRSA